MSAKTKKSNDQRVPVIEYEEVKKLRSLNMNYQLMTGELSSLVESYNNLLFVTSELFKKFCNQYPIRNEQQILKYSKETRNIVSINDINLLTSNDGGSSQSSVA